ncbi:MAG TPA: cytochrome d ubiquinol oxidase subunit II [Actinomycetes bacterium]|nr:cytochrome d ubiquinol oxidase subunit II [Actinomycetes bacterium]
MTLVTFWFAVLVVLWTGFLVLEGFDFGVGMLHGVVGGGEAGRRAAIRAVGPLWDGNEVWLIVAAAGMFAAFPGWYATMFSGFYLPLLLLLVALIARGVSFEFRGRRDGARWRRTWDAAMTGGSLLAPLLIGVALGNLLHGVPIGADQEYTGDLADLLNPYSLFTGVTFVLLCALHGATFLALKTTGGVRLRAVRTARRVAPLTVAAVLGFAVWTAVLADKGLPAWLPEVVAVLAAAAAAWLVGRDRDGAAFTATTVTIAMVVLSIFAGLYPRVMVSTAGSATDLTVTNTASSPYTLRVMTVVAAVLLPVVLAYQGWTYYVFRRRVGDLDVPAASDAGRG